MTPGLSTRATQREVAQAAGTSTAVVSYVINGGPRPVSEATRQRVLAAIKEVGYSPNPIAQALASGVSGTYGLIVPDISNPFFSALAHELEEALSTVHQVLLLGDSAESKEREGQLLEQFLGRQIDGILFIGVDSDPDLRAVSDAGVPVVLLDRIASDGQFASVSVDNAAGAAAATTHLIGHGYRDIGIIAGPSSLFPARERLHGWRRALSNAQIEPRTEWIVESDFSRAGGFAAGIGLLSADERPRAVFASNEQQAVGFVSAAAALGIKVPDEVALISFDGTESSEFAVPPISTVVQMLPEIARAAVRLLSDTYGEEAPHEQCAFELKIRSSCGPHRK